MNERGGHDHLQHWLEVAANPSEVEGVIAGDTTDPFLTRSREAIESKGFSTIIAPGTEGQSTSVRNWNAAASVATGSLLFVVSDDLFPPLQWDGLLLSLVGSLDPDRQSFAIKIADFGGDSGSLLRHPIVSRAYFRKYGLFDPSFSGVFCDTDLSKHAFQKAAIFDGRAAIFEHRHPLHDKSVERSQSQSRQYSGDALAKGESIYRRKWSLVTRLSPLRLLVPPSRRLARPLLVPKVLVNRGTSFAVGCGRLAFLGLRFIAREFRSRTHRPH